MVTITYTKKQNTGKLTIGELVAKNPGKLVCFRPRPGAVCLASDLDKQDDTIECLDLLVGMSRYLCTTRCVELDAEITIKEKE